MTAIGFGSIISTAKNPPNFECYKDLTMYGTLPRTCYFGYNITKGTVSNGCTWTCDEINTYCQQRLINADLGPALSQTFATSTVVMTPIAMISNLMLLGSFFLPAFRTTTFIYLRAIAVVELLHNALFVVPIDLQNVTFAVKLVDTFKGPLLEFTSMLKAMLSLSLAFERFFGVTLPVMYAKFSAGKLVIISFLVSIFMSSSCLVAIARNMIVLKVRKDNSTYYDSVVNMPVFRFNKDYWQQVIMIIRYAACCLMLAFSVVIVLRLRSRNRRIVKMMGEENAVRELAHMRKVCRFQLIEAFDITFGLVSQTLYTYHHLFFFGTVKIEDCTYANNARNAFKDIATNWITFFYNMTDIVSHFGLFYLYMLFNPMFRTELKRFVNLVVGKLTKNRHLFKTSSVIKIKSVVKVKSVAG